jgi:hypothetical protein
VVRLAAVAATSLVLTGAAGGSGVGLSGWFVLQGGTIYCGTELFPHEPPADPFLTCWRPRNGFALRMTDRGRAGARTNGFPRGYRTVGQRLAVGRTVWVSRDRSAGTGTPPPGARFLCTARPNWLICKNRAGYGWRFGRVSGWQFIVHG